MAMSDQLENIVGSVSELPPFPETALRVINILNDDSADTSDIMEVVQYDQAVTSNCLKLCNSSYFGLREQARSMRHALVLIGTDNLLMIVLANCSKIAAFSSAHGGYGLQPGELWKHSVACALLSQLLIKRAGMENDHELFVSALLHDIGKLVIDEFIADDFDAIYSLMQEDNYGFVEAEKEYYGIDHAELGGMISERWNFPQSLTDSIRSHHQSIDTKASADIGAWTNLTNLISHVPGESFSELQPTDPNTRQLDSAILTCFGLTEKDIEEVAGDLASEMRKAEDLLGI